MDASLYCFSDASGGCSPHGCSPKVMQAPVSWARPSCPSWLRAVCAFSFSFGLACAGLWSLSAPSAAQDNMPAAFAADALEAQLVQLGGAKGQDPAILSRLLAFGPEAIPTLGLVLVDKERPWSVRAGVAWVLGELGESSALPWLVKGQDAAGAPGTFVVQVAIARGNLGDPEALRAILQSSKDKIIIAKAATAAANQRDKQAVPAIKKWLTDPDIGPFIALALGRLGDEAGRSQLHTMLRDKNMRDYAAVALGRLGDRTVLLPVRFALKNPDPFLRRDAAELLGRFGDQASVQELAGLMNTETDPRVRVSIKRALRMLKRKARQR